MNLLNKPEAHDNLQLCERCSQPVDFWRDCLLRRDGNGDLRVVKCFACLQNPAPTRREATIDAWQIARDLLDAFGTDGALEQITRALFLPTPGTEWIYEADRVTLHCRFERIADELLHFDGPFGPWVCRRVDWIEHVAFGRVRRHHRADPSVPQ